MRVLLDVNVLVSALIAADAAAPPARLLQAVRDGTIDMCASEPLLEELSDVLSRPRIRKRLRVSDKRLAEFLSGLRELPDYWSGPLPAVRSSIRDAKDVYLLATALAVRADLLITGDADLLDLRIWQGIPIATPRRAVDAIFGS